MSNDPTDNKAVAPIAAPRRETYLEAEPSSPAAQLERLLKQTRDPLHQQYLRWFYDGKILPRIKLATKKLSADMTRRHRNGSSEFEHQPDDLIQHAWELTFRYRDEFKSGEQFLEKFVKRMKNYDRWRRRSQSAKARQQNPETTADLQTPAPDAQILDFPSPEAETSAKQELNLLHIAILRHAPELEPLFLVMLEGVLKPADMLERLGISANVLDAQRKRLRRLALRILSSER